MDANSHTRRDHRIGIARAATSLFSQVHQDSFDIDGQSTLVARLARNRIGGAIYGRANYGLLIPFCYHRERNTVQHAANRSRESRLDMRDLQTRATSCNA